ncbi:MAG: hypothetical protein L0206_01115 [Actinobacteria bacterium]|nr:hypothetical protein [Actinomycetota bacterium]
MARTEEGASLTQRHRTRQIAVRAGALRDLTRLWRAVDPSDLRRTIGPFSEGAGIVIQARHQTSAAVAARYFEAFRAAEGVRGVMAILGAGDLELELAAGLVRGAGIAGIVHVRESGFSVSASARSGFVRVAGTASDLVLSGGRDVITQAASADPEAGGRWQRITASKPCSFCAALAAQGPRFTETSVRFEAHNHCACSAEPAYEDTELPPVSRRFREIWEESTRGLSGDEAMQAFRRAHERANVGLGPLPEKDRF